ncbi:hypothetical protein PQS31_04985 [Luteimonas sp BLCC-B24]|nr:hypothetical protein [Luteimonas sp. BLCC-B24]
MSATNDTNHDSLLPEDGAPLRNLNPAPRDAYDIRVVLRGAPGPFAEIDAAAQYDVTNAGECGEPQPLSGAVPRISTTEKVALTRVSDTEFVGRVFMDQVLDEDYYGRGVCHWKFVETRVSMRESSDPMATWFVAAIDAEEIVRRASAATFFSSVHYPKAEIDNYANFGHESLDHVDAKDRGEFFEVELSAMEANQ